MIQNRFSNSNFVARKEGSVVAAVVVLAPKRTSDDLIFDSGFSR
jgi:hypothetical protein